MGSVGRILIVSLKAVFVPVGGEAADAAGACLSSIEGWPCPGKMWTMRRSLKPGTVLRVLLRA